MYGENQGGAVIKSPAGQAKAEMKRKRELAKWGMAISMGTLVYTGFRGKDASTLHIGSGLALVGFSYWHYRLYQPDVIRQGRR